MLLPDGFVHMGFENFERPMLQLTVHWHME